jgi:hypothetical protein
VQRTADAGRSWVDCTLPESGVFSVAVSAADGAVYAGTEPSRLFRSDDRGQSWRALDALLDLPSRPSWSFPPRPWTSHVRWIAPSPHDANLLLVGIELGGLMRSTDGGESWHDHCAAAQPDVHSLAWHPRLRGRAYEAGGGGAAFSVDGGESWQPADEGRDRNYTWSVTVDPDDPDCWFVSASTGPYAAHGGRDPQACITDDAMANRGSHSPAGCRSRCRRCPMHSTRLRGAYSLASPMVRYGKAATAAIAGRRCGSRATRSVPSSHSSTQALLSKLSSRVRRAARSLLRAGRRSRGQQRVLRRGARAA